MPHVPVRMCVICRERFAKQSLTRMVLDAQGAVIHDAKQCLAGRGFYVCHKATCQGKIDKYSPKKPNKRVGKRAQ